MKDTILSCLAGLNGGQMLFLCLFLALVFSMGFGAGFAFLANRPRRPRFFDHTSTGPKYPRPRP